MKATINILFLGGAKRYSLAERFMAAGKKLNCQVNIFSYELSQEVPLIGIAKEIIVGKRWNDPTIFEHLSTIIRQKEIHMVLPFVDPAIEIAATLKELLTGGAPCFPVSAKETCEIFYDKKKAQEWFTQHLFPVPPATSIPPVIAKPRKGSAGKGIVVLCTEEEYRSFKDTHDSNEYVFQQYLDAEEYTVDAFVSLSTGQILGTVPRLRLEVLGGEVVKSITRREKTIIELSEQVLAAGNFQGPVTLQFLKERTSGNIYLMEINPRFGGGVINSIEAGFDIPFLLLQEYFHQKPVPVNNWKENVMMIRTFREVFICK